MSLKKNHAYFVSQNFLTSGKTIRRLIAMAGITPDDWVIEIGFGKGHITRELMQCCRRLEAYEIDPLLYVKTSEKLAGAVNLSLRRQDFLKAALPPKGAYKVFSNIPFNHTTAILHKLTRALNPAQEINLIMEKGAAKRFLGLPRPGAASLALRPYFDARILYHFARTDFHPAPAVDVVMLQLKRKKVPDIPFKDRDMYQRFIETGPERLLSRRQTAVALKCAGLPLIPESADMLYVQWLCLFRCWRQCRRP